MIIVVFYSYPNKSGSNSGPVFAMARLHELVGKLHFYGLIDKRSFSMVSMNSSDERFYTIDDPD